MFGRLLADAKDIGAVSMEGDRSRLARSICASRIVVHVVAIVTRVHPLAIPKHRHIRLVASAHALDELGPVICFEINMLSYKKMLLADRLVFRQKKMLADLLVEYIALNSACGYRICRRCDTLCRASNRVTSNTENDIRM